MECPSLSKLKLFATLLGVSLMTQWSPPAAFADSELDEARARIAQLEEDVRQMRSERIVSPMVSGLPPSPDDPDEEETEEERKLGSLVQKYVRRMAEQPPMPSPKDPEQDDRISAVESKLGKVITKLSDGKTANAIFGNDGLFFTSNDGNFKMRFGGTFQFDAVNMASASSGVRIPQPYGLQDSVEFRRLRFRTEGTMWHNIDYVSEFDFALALQNTSPGIPGVNNPNNPANGLQATTANGGNGVQSGNTVNAMQPTTVFATIREVPVLGNVRVGNQQNWLSMEHIESARFTDFMERAPLTDAFTGPNNNGYAPGVSFFENSADKSVGWQAGVYKNNAYDSGYTYSLGDAWMYGGRVFWTPYYDEESNGRCLIHAGISSEFRQFNNQLNGANQGANIRLRSRGDLRNAASTLTPNYADTGNFFADNQ
ncbi:MAG TPA: porin, partial [Schlesneria sp.]